MQHVEAFNVTTYVDTRNERGKSEQTGGMDVNSILVIENTKDLVENPQKWVTDIFNSKLTYST